MSKRVRFRLIIILVIMVILFCIIAGILFYFYSLNTFNFEKNNAVSIFGSIIQGISALLSVAIAVIVFRIQSLENRNFSIEQSILNYTHRLIGWTYPEWISSVEEDIRNKSITNRYYSNLYKQYTTVPTFSEEDEKFLVTERDIQQKRLEEILNIHIRNKQIIKRIREGVVSSVIMLISPIIISFLMLLVSDALNSFANFVFVAVVIVMSVSYTHLTLPTTPYV